MRAFIVALIWCSPSALLAEIVESWECRDYSDNWSNILVNAVVFEGRKHGGIVVAGEIYRANYHVDGFIRRWDFNYKAGEGYTYSFTIEPNGIASYYDFSSRDRVWSSMHMKCRNVKKNKRTTK